jgi:hypothetical protein
MKPKSNEEKAIYLLEPEIRLVERDENLLLELH